MRIPPRVCVAGGCSADGDSRPLPTDAPRPSPVEAEHAPRMYRNVPRGRAVTWHDVGVELFGFVIGAAVAVLVLGVIGTGGPRRPA